MISDHEMNQLFAERIAAAAAKREQRRSLRAELAAARKIGKARRHADRLRESTPNPTNTEDR